MPCAQPILLVETDPDDPVSVTWIAFNGKLMGFGIKIFKKQFVCLLFSICSFIHNISWKHDHRILTCVSSFLVLIQCLITRITSANMLGNLIQFILSSSATSGFFFWKYVTSLNIQDSIWFFKRLFALMVRQKSFLN